MEYAKKEATIRLILLIIDLAIATMIVMSVIDIWKETKKNPIKAFFEGISNAKNNQNTNEGREVNNKETNKTSSGSSSPNQSFSYNGSKPNELSGDVSTTRCITYQMSYSIENPEEIPICLEYQGNICIKKELNCSAEINNLESEDGGNFKFQVNLIQKNTSDLVYSETKEFFLGPKESYFIKVYKIFENLEENGTANSEINCFYNKEKAPTKEICY